MLKKFLERLIYQGLEAIGKYYSVYRGWVMENEDPEKLCRLKIIIPSVTYDKVHPSWVYPRNIPSGKDYGLHCLPQKGDLVMVEFEQGDSRFPIWSHAHYSANEKPEEFISANIYGFKSPKGQIIIIDDDKEEIIINHGENVGLVKVIELTKKLNNLEGKVNDFLNHYRLHQMVDPLSGMAGPLLPTPPAPLNLIETNQSEIENTKVLH